MIAFAWLLSCMDPNQGTLSQNVGSAFAPCNEAEIGFYANKHNFMTAFRPCGNNHFEAFAWSPDGKKLYFQLGTEHHIMDAEAKDKATRVVPTPSHVGPATWLSPSRLVVPVRPGTDAAADAPDQLALYDLDQASVFAVDLPKGLTGLQDLQPAGEAGVILMSVPQNGTRTILRTAVADASMTPAFEWLNAEVLDGKAIQNFTYTPEQDALLVATTDEVHWFIGKTGEKKATYPKARRASLHRDGRWLMIESLGDQQSVFYQRAWDELPEKAREREQRRAARFEETLPESYQTKVRPPMLSFVDVPSGRRWKITSVHGSQFSWYPMSLFGSFMMWGFEGKQFRKNVLLGNFATRLLTAAADSTYIGVEPFEPVEPKTEAPVAE
ncbi:MAG: hypothetical protein AAGA48_02700 [Myxococcota bacterium]